MDRSKVKEVMDQVRISPETQEEIIMNIQSRMKNGNKNMGERNWTKMAAAAAVLMLSIGVIGFPVRAFVTSLAKERLESVPKEELRDLNDTVQEQETLADGLSREYSDSEKERFKVLWQAYENGTFPEKAIAQVERTEDTEEGMLCYVRSTGVFNLPEQEMTDEELLEIIDFQKKMDYAVAQGPQAQAARAEAQEKTARLERIVQDAGGISRDEAVEIAKEQLKTDLGDKAEGLELMTDRYGSGACILDALDFSEADLERDSRAGVMYDVGFGNPDNHSTYGYLIDAVDGSILRTWEYKAGE